MESLKTYELRMKVVLFAIMMQYICLISQIIFSFTKYETTFMIMNIFYFVLVLLFNFVRFE